MVFSEYRFEKSLSWKAFCELSSSVFSGNVLPIVNMLIRNFIGGSDLGRINSQEELIRNSALNCKSFVAL